MFFRGRPARGERGQVLLATALLVPVLTAMAAMAIDLGSYAAERRTLQNAADSIALAGAQGLCDGSCVGQWSATTAANAWAVKNGIDPATVTLTVSGGSTAPALTASIRRPHNFWFIRMIGIDSATVGASATAAVVSFGGGAGVVPWTVTQATVDAAANGALVTIKYDANGGSGGNFGVMRIDGSGASTYRTTAEYGATSTVCAANAPNCVPGGAENAPQCSGPTCNPENGNMTGPTRDAVDFRMQNTIASCNTFSQAFPAQNPDGTYQLAPACNPWLNGPGGCPAGPTGTPCSRRVMVIPVVNGFGNGQTPVTITRFALIYLEGYTGSCTGNSCSIQARFVRATLNASALAGTYDPGAPIHFVKLTQ